MSEPANDATDVAPARLLYDGLWQYRGYQGCFSVCHLRLFEPPETQKALIAVFTEMDDNPGTSVTNCIEHLATMVWHWQEQPPRGLAVVEHYPNRGMHNPTTGRWQIPEEFDFVAFTLCNGRSYTKPRWWRTSRHSIEEWISQPFKVISPTLLVHE